jgi:ParB family transcriptional regulator, chromosome partitioning protein
MRMKPELITTGQPFEGLFPIDAGILNAVAEDMERHGYDEAQPIVLWHERNVVLDGHTRVQAAISAGISDIPVVEKSFTTEDTAVEYAIHCQRDRRNLSDADLARWIDEVDRRKKAGRPKAEEEKLTPDGVNLEDHHARASSAETAAIVGTSARKVERIRTVNDRATPEVKAADARAPVCA